VVSHGPADAGGVLEVPMPDFQTFDPQSFEPGK
jgi:hypothetical protein